MRDFMIALFAAVLFGTNVQAMQGGDVLFCVCEKYTFFHFNDVEWTDYKREPIRFTVKISDDKTFISFGGSWHKARGETLPITYLSNRFLDAYNEFINLNIDLEAGFTATLSHSREAFIMAGRCEKF